MESNTIAYFGDARTAPHIVSYCREQGFRLFDAGNLDPSAAVWSAVRSAAVVVAKLQGPRGPAWAGTCYALGLAGCTGVPVVLLTEPGQAPPFDLDAPPIVLEEGGNLAAELAERIDAALYARRALDASESTVAATVSAARSMFEGGLGGTLFINLKGESAEDPVHVRALLVQALGVTGRGAPLLLTPAVPVPYPAPSERSCFHVTPFDRPGKAARFEAVRALARRACADAGITYLHGDEAADGRILRAIWNDIGRSEHVLVDLTDQNPNVAYELGIAHALGRKVLAIGQAGSEKALFPSIAKERITPYAPAAPDEALAPVLKRFLGG